MRTFRTLLASVVAVSFLASACGDADKADQASTTTHSEDEGYPFGEPASADDASRVIEIEANDDFTFAPATVDVTVGETVTFRVSNSGKLPHDFTLGDAEHQDEHDEEMAALSQEMMMGMEDEPNAFSLPAGEAKELTWHFTNAETVIFGCHIPGHYAAGMRGDIAVG